jgi:hypothetical protein
MPYVSVLAESIRTLLMARGWECEANRFTIRAVEPSLDNIGHVWMAGEKTVALTEGEISQVRPTRILVPDLAPAAEIERIETAMRSAGREPCVSRMTRFIDLLWDAPRAAERARLDAQTYDTFEGFIPSEGDASTRHVPQFLRLGEEHVADHRLLERALSVDGSALAILADAGLGKSELLKWHEWRCAVFYQSADAQRADTLPPVAVRVPLRGLRAFSLDAISHFLSHPSNDSELPALSRVDSGRFLLELLRRRRIILLLDGADELMVSGSKLEDGLREFRRAADDGARMAISSRISHLSSSRTIREVFKPGEVATIEPMTQDNGRDLLRKYGASEERAQEVLKALQSSKAQGIPLFLLLAYYVNLKNEFEVTVASSKTRVLLALLDLFCKRDEGRLGINSKEQLALLTDLAHWTQLEGELRVEDSLGYLGIDATEPRSAFLWNPHALLTRKNDGRIAFKYAEFFVLFAAKAISEDWRSLGFSSVVEDLRSSKLDDAIVEHMVWLLRDEDISGAWRVASTQAEFHRYPLVRRNILAIALARMEDECEGDSPATRSAYLAGLLGGKTISDMLLSDVVIQRIDLQGWTLRRLRGNASLLYCVNAKQCDFDDTVMGFSLEGTELPAKRDEAAQLTRGASRLDEMVKPLRRHGVDALIRLINLRECRDPQGWAALRRAGLADQERRYGGGERFWIINDAGTRTLTRFAYRDPKGLSDLVTDDLNLRELLLALGRER